MVADKARIKLSLTPDELVNIINDYECRLSNYEDQDDCTLDCQTTDPIVLRFSRTLEPCLCSDETKEARATIERLRAEFKKQAQDDYRAYFR